MQQRSEETRKHILDASLRLFSQAGYDNTGVAEICSAAGVSKGAFYHHFPSKQAVFIELLQGWLSGITEMMALDQQDGKTIPEILTVMAARMHDVLESAGGQLPLFFEFWLHASRDADIRKATLAPYHTYQSYFATLISKGIQEGTLRPVDPAKAAGVLVSLAVGLLLQGLLDPEGADWGDVAKESIQFFLEGLERKKA